MPRDEERAFAILQNLVATDRDSDAALSLAEAYLDGAGTSRDPIEAAVILWRVQHGAWSIYSEYWGMCMECDAFQQHEKVVSRRVDRELDSYQKARADIAAAARFPKIAARV